MKKRRDKSKTKRFLSNRWLYSFIALGIILIISGFVYAVAGAKPDPGHLLSELQPCSNGETLIVSGGVWTCNTGSSSQWTTSGSDIYYSAGRVGIGGTPNDALDVSGAIRWGYSPEPTTYFARSSLSADGSGAGKTTLSFQIHGWPGSTVTPLVLSALNRVGIGTSTPTSTLDVAGDIHASGTISASSVSLSCPSGYSRDNYNICITGRLGPAIWNTANAGCAASGAHICSLDELQLSSSAVCGSDGSVNEIWTDQFTEISETVVTGVGSRAGCDAQGGCGCSAYEGTRIGSTRYYYCCKASIA